MLGNVAVNKVTLPREHIKAQYTLVKEVLGEDLDVSLYFNTDLMQVRTWESVILFIFTKKDYKM